MKNFSNRCRWISEKNELHLNLSDLLNDTRILVLTGFNHRVGISMFIVTDEGIEQYDDPFTAPYFPIWECLDYDSCRDYLDQIPAEVMQALKPFRAESFGMLMLLSQNKFLTELCGKYSTLFFWLLFRQKIDHWSKQQFVNICLQDEITRLQACHLPANSIALQFLGKITASHCYTQFHSDLIQQTFKQLDFCHLNRTLETVPDHLLQFLLHYPDLQHVKFLGQLEQEDYHELLLTIRAIQHLAVELKIDSVNVTKQVLESDSISALKTLQAHLREEAAHRALQDYEKQLKSAEASSRSFPQLSLFADSDDLEQILNEADLLAESWLCQQNLMQYVPGILCGHYAVYQQRKPQRATAVYYLFPEQDGGLRPVLKCQYSPDDLIKLQ